MDNITVNYRSLENKTDRQSSICYQGNSMRRQSDKTECTDETIKLLCPDKEVTREITIKLKQNLSREATKERKAFLLAACLLLNFLSGGFAVALGVIYVDLIRVFEAPHSQAALVQSVFMGTMMGGGVLFTGILQKYGTGVPGIITSFIVALAFAGSSIAPNVPVLIALIGVIGGLSMGVNFLSAFITVGWTFRENRKTALALLTMGWTFGQTLFPYIAQFLLEAYSWNGSFVILSGIVLNCVPCGILMYKSKKFFLIIKPPASSTRETVTDCMKDYLFILFLISWFFSGSLMPVEMWFTADVAVVRGYDRSTGAVLLSLLGIFGFVGRTIATVFLKLFKRIDALVHTFYSILLWGVGHFLVGYFKELWGLVFAVVLRGVAAGITMAVMPGSQIELRGIERYPQTVAICNLIGGGSSILGGLVGGITVDVTGGYEFIFTLAAVVFLVCGILMIIVWLLSKRRQRKAELAGLKYILGEDIEKEPLISKNELSGRNK